MNTATPFLLAFLLLISSSSFLQAEEQFSIVFDAFDDCPCSVNPWETYTHPDNVDNCISNDNEDGTPGTPNCIDTNYGVGGCGLWDQNLGEDCTKENPEPYCHSAWCYVDTRNCNRPFSTEPHSLLARNLNDINSAEKDFFAYSFETCGYVDRFSSNQGAAAELAGRTLRVSFPNPSSVGTFFSYYDERNEEYAGAVHSFMDSVLDEMSVGISVVPLSEQSLRRFNTTSFTACVHDVALNNTDFCISDFWITPQRRLMTTFTEQFEEDLFYLYVPVSEEEDLPFSEILANPFRPFSRDVWLLICAFLFFTAICYLVLEHDNSDDFVEHDNYGSKLYHSTYLAFQSYGSASAMQVPKRKSTKMLLVGFGFFVLVMVSSYTAELASFFIREEAQTAIDSLESGLANGYKLCGYQAVKVDFLNIYPAAESAYVDVATGREGVGKLANGECDMVMLAIEDWEASQYLQFDNVDSSVLCSLRRVGEPLLTVGIANPIQAEYEPAMSWVITRVKTQFIRDRTTAMSEFLGDSSCVELEGGGDDDTEQLGLEDMGGVFFIAVLFYIVAALIHVVDVFVFDKDPVEKDVIKDAVLAALKEYHGESTSSLGSA